MKTPIRRSAPPSRITTMLRRAKSQATERYSTGGNPKVKKVPKTVTLPKFKSMEGEP